MTATDAVSRSLIHQAPLQLQRKGEGTSLLAASILDLWPLSDEIFDAYTTRGLAGFSLLTTTDCASRTWQRMLRSPVGWMG